MGYLSDEARQFTVGAMENFLKEHPQLTEVDAHLILNSSVVDCFRDDELPIDNRLLHLHKMYFYLIVPVYLIEKFWAFRDINLPKTITLHPDSNDVIYDYFVNKCKK